MRKTNLLMPLGLRKNLFRLFMVLLAIGWSTSAVWAEYWQIRVVAICDGLPAESWVAVGPNVSPYPTASSNDYTMEVSDRMSSGNPNVRFAVAEKGGETFKAWYLDPCLTQELFTGKTTLYPSKAGAIQRYTNSEDVQIQTIYAKFSKEVKITGPTHGSAPSAGRYYIYNNAAGKFLYVDSSDQILKANADISNALLFTLTGGITTTISAVIGNETMYLNQDGTGLVASPQTHTIDPTSDYYRVQLANGGYWRVNTSEGTYPTYSDAANTTHPFKWYFIPENTVINYTSVYGKRSDGSVTISESPTASGTAYVSFAVSSAGDASQHFTYSLSSNSENWVLGEPTRCGNVITVPVTYTAQNIHSGTETPASTTTVTITSKASEPTSATATATAYVDLQPTFEMAVSDLDWSYDGEDLVETFNAGMEVAASQRDRLANKLVYSSASIFAQNAIWTATITGDDAEHFKFANGTQSVSAPYSPELLDVIYAPQAAGTHSATLHIEVGYTDATSQTLTCVREVALSGKAQNVPMLTMALNGSEMASNNESLDFGEIIGTNSQTVTVDLYNHGLTNLTKAWVTSAEGVFEFDANTIDLSKSNQQLVIRAHRSTPVTSPANYEATLTISGKDGNNNDVSATLTLNYRALPLIPTTVTWNWALLNEDATYTNPITTNSDGEWVLVQRDGNGGMTYNAETKSITTEYMHHESGYMATFEFNIPQTDTYTARVDIDTFYARINAYIPPIIEINNQADVDAYVVEPTHWDSYLTYNSTTNAIICSGSNNVYFQWSGQSTFAFDYEMSTQYSDHSSGKIYGIYEDGTQQEIFSGDFYNDSTHLISIHPTIKTLRLNGNNTYKNIRYFEYDTIDVDYHGIVFIEGGSNTFDVTATYANKRAVTVSLNAAAQPYFELRAEGKPTGSSLLYDNTDGLAVHKFVKGKKFTVAIKDGV
ncbi:MAG: hypothetical protein IJP45_09015, partial [Paludibacteraceae bacterium]|nr:hypothetical protein [Paludibacteraceae bacterium]